MLNESGAYCGKMELEKYGVILGNKTAHQCNRMILGLGRTRANYIAVRRVFKHDSFEPLLVLASFALWHLLFYTLDTVFFEALKKWRIQSSADMRHWKVEGCGRLFVFLTTSKLEQLSGNVVACREVGAAEVGKEGNEGGEGNC
jgi:hypothetical protein